MKLREFFLTFPNTATLDLECPGEPMVSIPSFFPSNFFFSFSQSSINSLFSLSHVFSHLFQLFLSSFILIDYLFFYFPYFLSLSRFFSSLPIIFSPCIPIDSIIYTIINSHKFIPIFSPSDFVSSSPHNFKILNDLHISSYFLSLLTHISSYLSLLLNILINSIIFSLSLSYASS